MQRKRESEIAIQSACVKWFSLQYPRNKNLLIHVTNEGKRSYVNGKMLVRAGLIKGVADLILFIAKKGFHGLCVEMKTPSKTSRQSETQKEWQVLVEQQGYKYVVCRNLDEFIEVINDYLQ